MTAPTKCILASMPHHLDHLIPVSYYEKIPLLVRNNDTEEALLDFYPWVPYYRYESYPHLDQIEAFIGTVKTETTLRVLHHAIWGKTPKMVRLHHGHSDKIQDFSDYDTILSYKDFPNYRLKFYNEFKKELMAVAKPLLPVEEKEKPLLIALTWDTPDVEKHLELLCQHPMKERFVFRLHPILADRELMHIKLKVKHKIHLLTHDCPYIYPFLDLHAGILTDRSSIGYDALYFQKPLFVLDEVPLKKFSSTSLDAWIAACDNPKGNVDFRHEYTSIFGV